MSDGPVIALFGLLGILIAAIPSTITAITARRISVQARDHAATAAYAATATAAAIGEKNGHGSVQDGLLELREAFDALDTRLEQRTHILRDGATEPEEIGHYTQARMHDVLAALAAVMLKVDTLWRFLKDDYQLPDMPSASDPKEIP